jgi:iron complex transport system substrate-binding protein
MRAFVLLAFCLLASPARAAEPARVATLVPYAGAALAPHADRALVVASVRVDPRAPVANGAVDLGSPHSPNLELLAQARPALVATDAQMHGRFAEAIARAGAEPVPLDSSSVAATFSGLVALGAKLGLGAELEADVARAQAALAEQKLAQPVRVLALFGAPGSFFVVTERAWIGDLLKRQGFANVAPAGLAEGRFPGFAPLNDEVLLSLQPELVLLIAHGNPEGVRAAFERELETRPAWAAVRGSAKLGVHALDPALFSSNPGLDLPRAAAVLRALTETPLAP